ncbi:hypothetical protein TRFO_30504 [Tritrichomonas foetus]|uniref:Uncharacterized protein n=1 Tax=Tritrichomonas foetus TaxID=1144522 RepID=A0A1J4JTI3_9EUKA|nr:hypothetical protein TRFO_30504 [Tritrichomonas foetus]|eukprot:OHT02433.1 hypothetical protein TRFO_30504 [Tritrichomonas foetus]
MNVIDKELVVDDFMRPGEYSNTIKKGEKMFEIFPSPESELQRPYIQHMARLNTQVTSIRSFPFNPYFAIGSINTIYIASSQLISTVHFTQKESAIIDIIDVHPSSMFLACNGSQNDVRIMSLQNCKTVMNLNRHDKKISSIYFVPSLCKIYSTGYDGLIIISDLVKSKECYKYRNYEDKMAMTSSDMKDDESIISVGFDNGKIGIFDNREAEKAIEISAHSNWVNSVNFAPVGSYISSCSIDKSMKVWDLRNIEKPIMNKGELPFSLSKTIFLNESVLCGTSSDGKFIRWDFKNDTLISLMQVRDFGIFSSDVQREQDRLIISAEDNVVSFLYYDL